jgi:hypothetical protein
VATTAGVNSAGGGQPCPRCLPLAWNGQIRVETVQPLPPGAAAPLAEDGSGPCCYDCQAADTVSKVVFGGRQVWAALEPGASKRPLRAGMPFSAMRVVTGNERQEQLRLPESLRPHFGLVAQGLVRQSAGEKALDDHYAWMESVGLLRDGEAPDA